MYTRFVMCLTSLVGLAIWPQFAFSDVTIDNFTTGATKRVPVTCGFKDRTQTGSMVGGTRRTRLSVNEPPASCDAPNLYRQTASFQVRGKGPLLLNSDFRVFHRLTVSYGQDAQNTYLPLNLDLTEAGLNDRIRVSFAGNDLVENFNIVLYMHDGTSRSQCGMNVLPSTNPFSVDFPLNNFVTQLGTADYADVDIIVLIFQSGSAVGANDLAVQAVAATSGNDPFIQVSPCT